MQDNNALSAELEAKIAAAWPAILEQIVENSRPARDIVRDYGLTKAACVRYRFRHPDKDKEWRLAMRASGEGIQDEHMVTVRSEDMDPARMRARLSGLEKQAAWRDPDQYADRTKVDVTQHLDLTAVVSRAEARLAAARGARIIDAEIVEPEQAGLLL